MARYGTAVFFLAIDNGKYAEQMHWTISCNELTDNSLQNH